MKKIISNNSKKKLTLYSLLFSTLFLWPLPYRIPHTSVKYYAIIYFCFIGFGIGCLVFSRERNFFKQHKHLTIYLIFIVLNLLSFTLFTRDIALQSNPNPLKTTVAFVFFLALINSIQLNDMYSSSLKIFFYVNATFYLLLILLNLFVFDSSFLTQSLTLKFFQQSAQYNKNQIAIYLALIFPLVFAWFVSKKKILSLVVTAIIVFASLYTFSRMAFLCLLLALITFPIVARDKKKYVSIVAAILALCVILHLVFDLNPKKFLELKVAADKYPRELKWIDTESVRYRYFLKSLDGFKQAPIFGHGVGSFSWNTADYAPDSSLVRRHAATHNDYIQVMYELGMIGLLSFFSVLLYPLVRMWKCRDQIAKQYEWLWEGHFVAIIILMFSLNFINLYESMIFWYHLGVAEIVVNFCRDNQLKRCYHPLK